MRSLSLFFFFPAFYPRFPFDVGYGRTSCVYDLASFFLHPSVYARIVFVASIPDSGLFFCSAWRFLCSGRDACVALPSWACLCLAFGLLRTQTSLPDFSLCAPLASLPPCIYVSVNSFVARASPPPRACGSFRRFPCDERVALRISSDHAFFWWFPPLPFCCLSFHQCSPRRIVPLSV